MSPVVSSRHLLLLVRRSIRPAALVLLASTLLAAGAYTGHVFKALDVLLPKLMQALGLEGVYRALLHQSHSKITLQSLPSMLAYGLGYCLLCLLTLYVYWGKQRQFLLALLFYAGVFSLCFCLLVLGKALGDFVPAYNLARRLIEMIVSPLPVVLLVSTFSFGKTALQAKA